MTSSKILKNKKKIPHIPIMMIFIFIINITIMAKFYKKKNGVLVEFDGYDECIKTNSYRYGSLTEEPYQSDELPKCNLCGSELAFKKVGKNFWVLRCLNDECITNATQQKGRDCKLQAFLPKEYFENIKKQRKHTSYYDIEYLKRKGLSETEAEEYIKKHKDDIGKRNKGHNKEYFIQKFGENWYNEHILNLKCAHPNYKEYWINRGYSEEESIKLVSEIQRNASKQVKNRPKINYERIESKGIDAKLFFKKRSILCIEYWLERGYSEEEGRRKISEIQKNNGRKVVNHISNKTIEYWTKKGCSEEEAISIIRNIQSTFSKDKCIEKYGEVEGVKHWEERQYKWQKSLHENGNLHIGYSKISQELFDEILKFYPKDEHEYIFYASKNHEYSLKKPTKKYYAYDFTDLNKRKIIEFNGDIYHGNPNIFEDNEYPNPFQKDKTAEDLRKKDELKKQIAIDNGFDVLIVWESDYRKNREETIERIKNFLNI